MRRRNSSIEGMRCAARSRIVHPSTSARDAATGSVAIASSAVRARRFAESTGELAPEVKDDLHVVDAARTDRVAIAAEGAGPDRLDHVLGGEARLKRLVAPSSGEQVEPRLLVRRTPEDAQAAADAVAEVEVAHHVAHRPPVGRRRHHG